MNQLNQFSPQARYVEKQINHSIKSDSLIFLVITGNFGYQSHRNMNFKIWIRVLNRSFKELLQYQNWLTYLMGIQAIFEHRFLCYTIGCINFFLFIFTTTTLFHTIIIITLLTYFWSRFFISILYLYHCRLIFLLNPDTNNNVFKRLFQKFVKTNVNSSVWHSWDPIPNFSACTKFNFSTGNMHSS